MRIISLLAILLLLIPSSIHAQHHFRVLHSFGHGKDGTGVYASVVLDARGNLYGSTSTGGDWDWGAVFRLTPEKNGSWKDTILHSFNYTDDGGIYAAGGVTLGRNGVIYGSTTNHGEYGGGTAFKLTPRRGGGWSFQVIHQFSGPGDDACCPTGPLLLDPQGNLFGASYAAFELSRTAGKWTETQLHLFQGHGGDGVGAVGGPIRDGAGNIYGVTAYGGGSNYCDAGCGTVWELSPPGPGSATQGWTEHVLHRFNLTRDDGAFPNGGELAMDAEGNLYGTTGNGGPGGAGTVFKLAPVRKDGREWTETILHGFAQDQNGFLPEAGVTLDHSGNLYGTTGTGGTGCGVIFKLSPANDKAWKYTVLYIFNHFDQADGCAPDANLTFAPDGRLYGTTSVGGAYGGGVVFALTP